MGVSAGRAPAALVVDWGGVLTTDLVESMTRWADGDDIDYAAYDDVMRDWLGQAYGDEAHLNPVHSLERGEMEVADFEVRLAARLRTRKGGPVRAEGLLTRMFAYFEHAPAMSAVVRQARHAGVRTALLSNSWGSHYPRDGWDGMFDAVVISGEVGMRKPEPAIFHYTADRLGIAVSDCVFVDDMARNVRGAVDVGMIGLHHVTFERTVAELEALFGISLRV